LLQAAALVREHNVKLRFVIAGQGKGPLYDDLLKLKDELALGDMVYFIGFISDPADFLSNLDLFLLSSTSEGFSIATIQAMAAGLPVIATRSGGPQEIITHGVNGWLVDSGNPKLIAKAVESLSADRELSQRIENTGQKHAIDTFDAKNMISAYEKIYNICM
jgi:glycosyltransferase involved in cell wall biosynthesis